MLFRSGQKELISLEQEIEFLQNYIAIENIRWEDKLAVSTEWEVEDGNIEPKYVVLMLISIAINYTFGMLLDGAKKKEGRRILMALCLVINLGLLGYYKYFNFLVELVNDLLNREALAAREIVLPIGISFYTFQALSYVVDVYRGTIKVQKNPLDLALYISFFPQLIAGPMNMQTIGRHLLIYLHQVLRFLEIL